jgi:hypothetical protein
MNRFTRVRSIRAHALCLLTGQPIATTPPTSKESDSMSPTSTYLVALEHTNDLLREGEQHRGAGELTTSRRSRPRVAEARTYATASADAVTIRFSGPADHRTLEALAQLDCARPPHGPHLVAEVGGALRAAISLTNGLIIADPFHRTAALVELLRARANPQLSDQRALRRTPIYLLRRLARGRKRNWQAVSRHRPRRSTIGRRNPAVPR